MCELYISALDHATELKLSTICTSDIHKQIVLVLSRLSDSTQHMLFISALEQAGVLILGKFFSFRSQKHNL